MMQLFSKTISPTSPVLVLTYIEMVKFEKKNYATISELLVCRKNSNSLIWREN
jgi:hypothetical protein